MARVEAVGNGDVVRGREKNGGTTKEVGTKVSLVDDSKGRVRHVDKRLVRRAATRVTPPPPPILSTVVENANNFQESSLGWLTLAGSLQI